MRRHAQYGAALMQDLVLGRYETANRHLDALIEQPDVARPLPGDPTLNDALSERFFAMEEQYRRQLTQLRASLRTRDEQLMMADFTALLGACRQCHRELGVSTPSRDGGPPAPDVLLE